MSIDGEFNVREVAQVACELSGVGDEGEVDVFRHIGRMRRSHQGFSGGNNRG